MLPRYKYKYKGYLAVLVIIVVLRHHSWVGLLIASLPGQLAPSSTMNARSQKGGFDVRSSANLLSAVNCVVSSAIGTLTSQRQPRATAIACSVVFL